MARQRPLSIASQRDQRHLIDVLWVGSVDPGKEWALAMRPLLAPGGYQMLDGKQWVMESHRSLDMKASSPEIVSMICHRIATRHSKHLMLLGIEGAYIKEGFGKKQALAYAMRVGWFQMAFSLVPGVTPVIIPPAYGKGGLAWKREIEVSGMSLKQQQDWCQNMLGVWPADEHEADALALCHFIQTRVHKHLTIGVHIPKCLQDGIKAIKKERAAE